MNILLIVGLVLFACTITWIYVLFVSSTINDNKKEEVPQETHVDDALERCKKLFNQGLHAELQRYAQRELSKNYGDVELRKILAQSLMLSGNEQMAIMHYEAILSIAPYDVKTQELLAQYYCENGPKSRAIELYEQILMYDGGNVHAVETLSKLYEETQNYEKAIETYKMLIDAEIDEQRKIELEYTLADLYIKIGDNENAFNSYEIIHKRKEN